MILGLARPWKHPKTGTYWFRRRVPKELSLLLGRSEERRTLKTKEPALARSRYLKVATEVDERWARLRQALTVLGSQGTMDRPICVASEEQDPAWPLPEQASMHVPTQLPIVPSQPCQVVVRDAVCAGTAGPAPWRKVFAAYAAEARPAPSTVKRWTGVFASLEEAVGTDDLARVTRDDLLAWKVELLSAGRDPRTVRDAYLASVKAVMNWAVSNGRLTENPAVGITVSLPRKLTMRDRDFTDDEALLILRAGLGPHNSRLSREHAAARRWIPWLNAYGGARVNEMTQLRGTDVQCDGEFPFLRITPEAGTVKTGKWRDVPLHPHIIEQGFLDFVRGRGPGPLFYDPARGRNGQAAHPIYKKVGERLAAWVRSIGVDDIGVDPNHGWRHRFKTVGRRAGIDPAVLDAIQGHAPRTEGEHYGRYPLEVTAAAIARMPRYEV